MGMIRRFAVAAALVCVCFDGALAADNWIGAWGFPAIPLPPGFTPPTPASNPPAVTPLGTSLPVAAVTATPPQPLLDNPGNVPVIVANPELSNATVRQLVRVAVGGKRLRLRLTNENGISTLVVSAVRIGQAGPDGSIVAGADHAVTFDGHPGVAIPAGAPLLSDPVDLPVKALDRLVISVHVPGPITAGGHSLWQYVAGDHRDHTGDASLPGASLMRVTSLVSEVEVDAPGNVIVTLGDSITEGAQSTANAFRGWPDRLAERLAARRGNTWSVVNAGIGGNRLLRYGTGPDALARLDRDVLSVPGLKTIMLLEGINDIGDIGHNFFPGSTVEPVTAEALEAADKQIIARAHAHGIKVIGATLTPYEGANYYTAKGEAVREALNQWILTGGAFDGVVDFAAAIADPAHVTMFRAGYNLRDHLHPNDDGYQAMANAIDLKLVTGGK